MSVPKRIPSDEWLWVGWFSTNWTGGEDKAMRARSDVAVDLPRLVIIQGDRGLGAMDYRFLIHKDLIDE